MKIANHHLELSVRHQQSHTEVVTETTANRALDRTASPAPLTPKPKPIVTSAHSAEQPNTLAPDTVSLENEDSQVRFIRLLLQAMSQNKISALSREHFQFEQSTPDSSRKIALSNITITQTNLDNARNRELDDLPPVERRTEKITERTTERITHTSQSFNAVLKLQTEEGKQLEVSFSSLFFEAQSKNSQTQLIIDGKIIDPLVLTFGRDSPELSHQKVNFDLDADGGLDSISYATGASAFLALDKNGNGRIDDGSEMFGAISGDGFADLAIYDDNKDGIIDSSDLVFEQLQLSRVNSRGELQLGPLSEAKVAAIFLNSITTPQTLADEHNNTEALVRKSSIFLYLDYQAGLIQHVDIIA